MKNIKSVLALGVMVAGGAFLASCNNDLPKFSDSDAFVAFTSATAYAEENGDSVVIPVMLTSLHGMDADVEFEVTDSTAVEGTHFSFEGDKVLHFTKDNPTQNIVVKIIDNDVYGGNVAFTINLKASNKVNLGASKLCTVRINDNEHPLLFLFNNYGGTITDYWGYTWELNGSITRDPDDDHVVWFNNFYMYMLGNGYAPDNFYGVVNDEKTEILVPAGQTSGYNYSGSPIALWVFDSDDPDAGEMYDTGYNLHVRIEDNGATLVFEEAWGLSQGQYFWDLYNGGVTVTKQ